MAFCFIQTNASAQNEKETPYWYVSNYKVNWAKVDSLQGLVTKYTVPIVAQAKKNGTILDYHFLIHHTGNTNNVKIVEDIIPPITTVANGR